MRRTLALLIASATAPLAVGTMAVLVVESQRSGDVERERLGALATTLLQGVDAELSRARSELEVLAASPQLASGDLPQLHKFAKTVADKVPGTIITLVDASGRGLFSTEVRWGEPLPNFWRMAHENKRAEWNGSSLPVGSEDLSRRSMAENRVTYSGLYYTVFKRPALAVAMPVSGYRGARLALVMSFPPDLIQAMVASSINARGLRVIVTDRYGVVVARNAAAVLSIGDQGSQIATSSPSGSYTFIATDKRVLDAAFAVSQVNGFVVRVAQAVPAPLLRPATLTWLSLLGLASGAAVALVVVFARRLARPITQLAADLLHGRMPRSDSGPQIVEFQLLARAVGTAVEAERWRRAAEERKLRETNDRALFAEQMVGIVSHDLRSPLLAARLSANAVEAAQISSEARVLLKQVQAAVCRADALVHDLLDFTRARIGTGLPVDLAPIDLHAVIARHLVTLGLSYPTHRLVHEMSGAGTCEADGDRLVQLTDNLVNNAVMFGASDEPILVRTTIAREEFSIAVHNKGVPIPEDILPRLFEPMVRSPKTSGRRAEGVGLGLFIVHEIARAHSGDAKVVSTLDQGTTVTASFPR